MRIQQSHLEQMTSETKHIVCILATLALSLCDLRHHVVERCWAEIMPIGGVGNVRDCLDFARFVAGFSFVAGVRFVARRSWWCTPTMGTLCPNLSEIPLWRDGKLHLETDITPTFPMIEVRHHLVLMSGREAVRYTPAFLSGLGHESDYSSEIRGCATMIGTTLPKSPGMLIYPPHQSRGVWKIGAPDYGAVPEYPGRMPGSRRGCWRGYG